MADETAERPQRGPGDLGRRVSARRHDLGITRDELARQAGVTRGYVDYVEERPAVVTAGVLLRLAEALNTTPEVLLGDGADVPPGSGTAASHPRLEVLSQDECARLLSAGGVGRVVLVDERGPAALPVNFAVLHGDVVFRTAAASVLAEVDGQLIGFEVDRIDDPMREGWSVLVTGRAHLVDDPGALAEAADLPIDPWAGGRRDVVVRLTASEVSGRRIHSQR